MNKYLKYLFTFLVFSFIFISLSVSAHSVQVGYCVNCNGDLRVWVEHWHTTENPATTTMNLEINVDGTITSVSGIPDTSVTGITVGNLPGCFTPMTTFVTCQGTGIYMPNAHNDWVAYDFNGLPCGVPIEITVISGNTVFTQDCGSPTNMYPASSGQFIIPCATNQLPDVDTCAGNVVGPFLFPTGNTWTNSNPNIGLAASGTGNVPAFIGANNASVETGTITVNNTCGFSTFDVTIYPAPVSDFIPNVGCPGQPVTFNEQSTSLGGPITGWTWDFGDGSPNFNGQNPPPHVYPAGGPFNVTLTTTTANGCTHDTIIPVDPLSGLIAGFSAPSLCSGLTTNFIDGSTPVGNITNWAWDFDNDGVVDDITQNPNFTFPGVGTYNVELYVVGVGGCVDSILVPIVVNPIPVANFSGTTECLATATTFNDLSNVITGTVTGWQWDFGDLTTTNDTSSLQNPTYVYPALGTYNVTLTVTSDSGCTDVFNLNIDVLGIPMANFTTNTACAGSNTSFLDISMQSSIGLSNWAWDFDNDAIVDDINQNPTYVFPGGVGAYPVNLAIVDSNGCIHDTTITVNVSAQPTAAFTFTNECFGTATGFTDVSLPNGGTITNWAWDFDNDGVVDDANQNTTNGYPLAGNYMAKLLVTTALGCVDSITIAIIVDPIPVSNFSGTTECLGTATVFNDLSNVITGAVTGWTWNFGDGVGMSTLQNPTYTYGASGAYNVTLTVMSDSGCTDDTTITININANPVANFTPNTACAGANSLFSDVSIPASIGLSNWAWDFDNDAVVDDINQNPTYVFPGGVGAYPVNLTIVDSNGCIHDTTITVNVSAQPTAAFTFTNECFGSATGFTDLSLPNGGTITNWAWDFDNDGTTDNTTQNTTNGYPLAGTYIAELLVTTALGCVDSTTLQVVVNPVPVADFSVADVCFNTISSFNDLSNVITGNITSWSWDFGDAAITTDTSSMQNPTYMYANPGIYNVTLTVTTDSLCSNTFIGIANVYFLPTASFTTSNVCLNLFASFTDNSNGNGGVITNWAWDFDGNGTTDDTSPDPTNLYATEGTYNVQLIASTGSGCADTIIQPIVIHPMPVSNYTFVNSCLNTPVTFTDVSSVSSGAIVGWSWDFDNTNTSIIQNPSENYVLQGLYNVELIVVTDSGCADTTVQQIEVWPNPVVSFGPDEVCLNAATQFTNMTTVSNTFTANTIVSWAWDFDGNGTIDDVNQSPIYTYSTDGIFAANLSVISNNGCVHDTTINVTVNPLPQVIFGNPTAGCAPNMCVNFVNNTTINTTNQPSATIASWAWDFGDGGVSGAMNPTNCYENGSYTTLQNFDVTLIATSDKQCTDSVTMQNLVTVFPKPLAYFDYSPDDANIYDTEIIFTDLSQNASVYLWDLGDGTTSTIANPIHEYPDSGTYVVTLYMENIYGCRDTTQRTVIIDPVFAIWIPNTFTVDGDGINDFFFATGFGILELQTLVFDRWGALVYEGYTLDSKWDGTYKGKASVTDVYVYKIKARDVFNEWHEFVGRITLLK